MPLIRVVEKATEAQGSFRSHRTWLRAFAQAAGFDPFGSTTETLAALRQQVQAGPVFSGMVTRSSPSLGQIRISLAHAWGTELLLGLSGRYATEDALKRLTINWGVVQLYYTLYHATQALFVAETGQDRPEEHTTTRRIFTDRWCTRVHDPAFLAMAYGPDGPVNVPPGVPVDARIHPWKTCDAETCWSHALLALRTTRRDDVDDAQRRMRGEKQRANRKAWVARERERRDRGRAARVEPLLPLPLLTVAEKEQVNERVRPYSLIDYAYRLRIKTNYSDSAVFTEGPTAEGEAGAVHLDLVRLATASMLVHELHVRQLVGADRMRVLVDGWLKANLQPGLRLGLALRRDLVLGS